MSATSTMAIPAPHKLSRYASLRGKSVSDGRHEADQVLLKEEEHKAVASGLFKNVRNRSHSQGQTQNKAARIRARTVSAGASENAPNPPAKPYPPPVPPLPRGAGDLESPSVRYEGLNPLRSYPPTLGLQGPGFDPQTATVATAITVDDAVAAPINPVSLFGRERGFQARQNQAGRWYREEEEAARWAGEVARLEAETDRILAEQRKKDLARQLRSQLSPPASTISSVKSKSPVLERFPFLARGRRSNAATLSPTSSMCASIDSTRASSLEPNLLPRNFMETAAKTASPQMDAPISASNSGVERRIKVRYPGGTLDIPVDLGTSTVDVLWECSNQTTHPINTSTSILIETYSQLGLERRLRRYERIWNVLDSWDKDTQNSLLLLPDTLESDKELDLGSVPVTDDPPRGITLQLYHSQRPGRWNKRYITLHEGGQIFSSKKEDPNPTDKDVLALCHLSDFDIYTPTEAQVRRQLKPPKKYCYAIKSQQKTTLFVHAENFVHFFCTDEPESARRFRATVQAWRSWYLVNRTPIGAPDDTPSRASSISTLKTKDDRDDREDKYDKGEQKPPQIVVVKHKPKKSISHVKVHGHRVRVSVDESPYVIGEFSPLINLERFNKPLEEFGEDWEPDPSRQSTFPAEKPRDFKKEITKLELGLPLLSMDGDDSFDANGLLGSAYNDRVQAHKGSRTGSRSQSTFDGPFTAGPNLLNGGLSNVPSVFSSKNPSTASSIKSVSSTASRKFDSGSWFPSAIEHTAKTKTSRSGSSRPSTASTTNTSQDRGERDSSRRNARNPAPLVNLTPAFIEPPQWSRDHVGRAVKAPEGTMLIDLATSSNLPAIQARFRDNTAPPPRLIRRETAPQAQQAQQVYVSRPGTSEGRPVLVSGRQKPGASQERAHAVPPIPPLPLRTSSRESDASFGAPPRDQKRPRGFAPMRPSPPGSAGSWGESERSRARLKSDTTLRF